MYYLLEKWVWLNQINFYLLFMKINLKNN